MGDPSRCHLPPLRSSHISRASTHGGRWPRGARVRQGLTHCTWSLSSLCRWPCSASSGWPGRVGSGCPTRRPLRQHGLSANADAQQHHRLVDDRHESTTCIASSCRSMLVQGRPARHADLYMTKDVKLLARPCHESLLQTGVIADMGRPTPDGTRQKLRQAHVASVLPLLPCGRFYNRKETPFE
jgi:hypothetical protein